MESETIDQNMGCGIEPRVAVVGIGGAGCNAASDIYWADGSVDIIAINTDRKALSGASADKKLYICKEVTKGEGTKGDSDIGRNCAKVHAREIEDALSGYDTVFIIAGLGGGTGSGVAPVVADIARRLNIITFAVLINPFSFESGRMRTASDALSQIDKVCGMVTLVENDLVMKKFPNATMNEAFASVNQSICRFVGKQISKVTHAFSPHMALSEIVREPVSKYINARVPN